MSSAPLSPPSPMASSQAMLGAGPMPAMLPQLPPPTAACRLAAPDVGHADAAPCSMLQQPLAASAPPPKVAAPCVGLQLEDALVPCPPRLLQKQHSQQQQQHSQQQLQQE